MLDAGQLEDKIARTTAKTRCSFDEVYSLYNEVKDWLDHNERFKSQVSYIMSTTAILC